MRQITTLLLLLALPSPSLAQQPRSTAGETPPAPSLQLERVSASEVSTGRIITMASGVLVGAWMGYMASQVAVGDWDDREINRVGWAAGGAVLGLTAGLTIPLSPARRRPPAVAPPDRLARDNVLTAAELRSNGGGTLYEVIRSLRPQWLRTRGTGSMRETARGTASGVGNVEIDVQPGIEALRVYLDGSLLGGVDELRTIDPAQVGEARFLTPAVATQRWGAGHIHGAILVITASSM